MFHEHEKWSIQSQLDIKRIFFKNLPHLKVSLNKTHVTIFSETSHMRFLRENFLKKIRHSAIAIALAGTLTVPMAAQAVEWICVCDINVCLCIIFPD